MSIKSVKEINSEYKKAEEGLDIKALEEFIELNLNDERNGVQKLNKRAFKKINDYYKEIERVESLKKFDYSFGDYKRVCGIDEVGRGPIAGPVVTCAVIMRADSKLMYVNDSKKLSAKKREELYDKIIEEAITYSIALVEPDEIDEINILRATIKSMKKSIIGLKIKPDLILVDAVKLDDIDIEKRAIIKGDEKSYATACASILAKVYRDRLMAEYDKIYPGYDFYKHKGYGTKEHFESVEKYGVSPIHRLSFIPDKYLI